MIQRFIQAVLLLVAFAGATISQEAFSATYYVRDCGVGASGTCSPNASGDTYNITQVQNQATPIKTCARVKALLFATNTTMPAGSSILFARGGAWDDCIMTFLSNVNATKDSPITFGAYDPGGETAKPILNAKSSTVIQLEDSGSTEKDEGFIIEDLDFRGFNSAQLAIKLRGDVDYVTIQRIEARGFGGAIQCDGGTTAGQNGGSDGYTEHIVIRDNYLHDNYGNTLLLGCNDVLVENNIITDSGASVGDHHIYLQDMDLGGVSPMLRQVAVRGNTMLRNTPWKSATFTVTSANPGVVTWTSHALTANQPVIPVTTGALPTNLVHGTAYYVVGASITANTFQVSATPGGAAIDTTAGTQSGTHTMWANVPGGCKSTAVIVHGLKRGIIFENNILGETTAPTSFGCWGVSFDTGSYGGIYSVEGLYDLIVRGNVVYNFYFGIGMDIAQRALVENNYVYSAVQSGNNPECGRMRAKYFQVIDGDDEDTDSISFINNSCFLATPGTSSVGWRFDRHASDAVVGGNHKAVNNLVHFGTGSGAATACFSTRNRASTEFSAFDNNLCNFAGTAGVWMNDGTTAAPTTKTLAAWRTASSLDANSSQTNTAATVIFAVTPASGNGYSLATITTSPTKNVGNAANCSVFTIFGIVRASVDANCDIGAFEFGQAGGDPAPPSPTRITVQ